MQSKCREQDRMKKKTHWTHRLSVPPRFAFLSVQGNRSFHPVQLATYKSTFKINWKILWFHSVTTLPLLMCHAAVIIPLLRLVAITTVDWKSFSCCESRVCVSRTSAPERSETLCWSACLQSLQSCCLTPWLAYRLLVRIFGYIRDHSAAHESIRFVSA